MKIHKGHGIGEVEYLVKVGCVLSVLIAVEYRPGLLKSMLNRIFRLHEPGKIKLYCRGNQRSFKLAPRGNDKATCVVVDCVNIIQIGVYRAGERRCFPSLCDTSLSSNCFICFTNNTCNFPFHPCSQLQAIWDFMIGVLLILQIPSHQWRQ